MSKFLAVVLNLIITGMPSIQTGCWRAMAKDDSNVLNLVISGIPSIHNRNFEQRFKDNLF